MNEYIKGNVANIISQNLKSKKSNISIENNNQRGKLSVKKVKKQEKSEKKNSNKAKKNIPGAQNYVISTSKGIKLKKKNALVETKAEAKRTDVKNLTKKLTVGELLSSKRKPSKNEEAVLQKQGKPSYNLQKIDEIPGFDDIPSDSSEEISMHTPSKKRKMDKESLPVCHKQQLLDLTENTVFVGNLPLTYDKDKVKKCFSKFGKVEKARIRCIPVASINMKKKVAAIKKEFNPHRNSLVAFVRFKSKDAVQAAVEANGMVLDGHHIRIDLASNNKEPDSSKAIFVGGLPFDITEDELWNFFQDCGEINNVRIIRDSHTLMGKGFGYVNFESTASVELALQMEGKTLKKRTINIQRCLGKTLKSKAKAFGKQKSGEVVNQLLCKKNKYKKSKEIKPKSVEFRGNQANQKKKRKKKLSKDAMMKKKFVKVLLGNKKK